MEDRYLKGDGEGGERDEEGREIERGQMKRGVV